MYDSPWKKLWQAVIVPVETKLQNVRPESRYGAYSLSVTPKTPAKTVQSTAVMAIGCNSDQPMPRNERR